MASLSRYYVLTLFLVTVLRASHVARSDQSHHGGQVADHLGSLPTSRKLLGSTSIGKKPEANGGPWCVPSDGVQETTLKGNIDLACHAADCKPILPGGPCFEPNTLRSHAAYAMNSFFQTKDKDPKSCEFSGSGTILNKDPSYGNCKYPG